MNKQNNRLSVGQSLWLGIALALCAALLVIGGTSKAEAVTATPNASVSFISPDVTCPSGQCFTDVPPANGFYTNINALYLDGIIGGYACGGSGEPCDGQSRPYYRPGNTVSRQQMSKFLDLGRRNIADAIGNSLAISTTAYTAAAFTTNSSGYGVYAQCIHAAQNCYAVSGSAAAGDYAAVLSGGRGVYTSAADNGYSGVNGNATGTTAGSYGGIFTNNNWNSLRVAGTSTSRAQAYVSGTAGNLYAIDVDPGGAFINGNLTVTGSKTGYVVDEMQNVGDTPLEPGDVVVMVGQSTSILGDIPVITVRKATSAYDTGVAGVVDAALYVPDAATKAAYEAQQQAVRDAEAQRSQIMAAASANGTKADLSSVKMPDAPITDADGIQHATDATTIPTNSYANVVTLGAYKMVKVDASFGAIHTGDLLTTSSHEGYAMKATDRSQAFGATIGKAIGSIDSGTGTIAVLVSLK